MIKDNGVEMILVIVFTYVPSHFESGYYNTGYLCKQNIKLESAIYRTNEIL